MQGEAISSLVGLTRCVSSVVWPEREAIYSASWDHSIRRWDVETGKDSMNMVRKINFFPFFSFILDPIANLHIFVEPPTSIPLQDYFFPSTYTFSFGLEI